MEVLAQKPYCWTLLRDQQDYILSAVNNARALSTCEFRLIAREVQLYETYGEEILDDLTRQVTQSPSAFNARMIKNFSQDERVSEAFALWHKKRAQAK
ncbi:hypothetical protein L1286_06225 [Pseudoalteromonas sp. SMS1]|uniref:hypothetical protein n=1 Tax=Pseudoalteromonas sp. SMS1 TaxID=2908894 RepID=UPI001F3E2F4E|nr:hypothetical protein [Pseudoalteromonas sp. SMS1]MCF2857056.1 hypothetical protein [Pseudoalteromonas sp. SMS1]